jgi:RNA polymerase sigma-70 factor (sigma-E family)
MITAVTAAGEQVARVDRDELLQHLFATEYTALVRLAALLVDERASAEDIVQEAFVRLHRRAPYVRDVDAAPAYLRSIVLNLARSQLRHRLVVARYRPIADATPTDPADHAVLRDDQQAVIDAIRSLPRRQRECIALRYYSGLSEAEIADALGISGGSVKSHTSRAMAALAEKLEAR